MYNQMLKHRKIKATFILDEEIDIFTIFSHIF